MVLLTIGMIVKNEIEHLRDCLEALGSLRKNVPCELIISDTGSTDGTREIAAGYADILVDFEWCNDFAAARNSTVDRASGKWYMFIDADEIFESTKEIEEFFLSGEYKNYHSGSYKIHSYVDSEHSKFIDTMGARLFDLSMPNSRFMYTVHEAIPCYEPTKLFTDFVHHYGYIKDNVEKEQKKHERNLELLYAVLEKDPEDTRTLSHLSREFNPFGKEGEEVLKYCNLGIKALQKKYQKRIALGMISKTVHLAEISGDFFTFYHQKGIVLNNTQEWSKLKTHCQQYFKNTGKTYRCDIDMFYLYARACFYLDEYETAIEMYRNYFRLLDSYEKNELVTDDMLFCYIQLIEMSYKVESLVSIVNCFLKEKRYEEAFEYLERLPIEGNGHSELAFKCMVSCDNYEYVQTLWSKFVETGKPENEENFIYSIESYIARNPDKKQSIIKALAEYQGDGNSAYLNMNQMRQAFEEKTFDTVDDILAELLSIKPFPRLLDDTIYYIMCRNMNISILFESVVLDDLKVYIADIKEGHSDFAEVVKNYFMENQYINSDYGMYWELMFEEAALLTNDLYDEDALKLLPNYLEAIISYTNLIYDKQMLNEDKLGVLPNYARFAYYVGQAFEANKNGDELGYYRNMTKAVDQYKVMAKPIKLLTDHHQKEIEERQNKAKQDNQELMELAAQVKKQLYAFIEQENYPTAKDVLAGYEKIFPTDPDLATIREMIVAGESGNRSAIPS